MKNMTFRIQNQITKRVFTFEVADFEDSRQYHHFSIKFDNDMDEGAYNYVLLDEDGVQVSDGILQVGDYTDDNNNEYNSDTNEYYRQYRG